MAVNVLVHAQELVVRGWCQGTQAKDGAGEHVSAWSEDARAWSALGALIASWHGAPPADLASAASALARSTEDGTLRAWNDDPARTREDVIAAFDRAIGRLRTLE